MSRVLITAFKPYDNWTANASWLCLEHLTRDLPPEPAVTTRLYPVDYAAVRQALEVDLAANYDYAIHLGQAPGSTRICLELVALNLAKAGSSSVEEWQPLELPDAPLAMQSTLPLADWAALMRSADIPACVSHHAGTFLCNATLYWSLWLSHQMQLATRSAFIHLPLAPAQVAAGLGPQPCLSTDLCSAALRLLLEQLSAP